MSYYDAPGGRLPKGPGLQDLLLLERGLDTEDRARQADAHDDG